MNIRQWLKDIGIGILNLCESMAELHRKRMETLTPCRRCTEDYLYKELRPSSSFLWAYGESSPYKQMLNRMLLKEIRYPHRYCPACWEIIYQAINKKCEEEYRLTILLCEEARLVRTHNERARQQGRESTLTITEWSKTLDHYEWRCAYCGGPYEELDHWIPLDGAGGTTANNCVPSCRSCNRRKGTRHPDTIMGQESSLSPGAHRRIQAEMEALHGNGVTTFLPPIFSAKQQES